MKKSFSIIHDNGSLAADFISFASGLVLTFAIANTIGCTQPKVDRQNNEASTQMEPLSRKPIGNPIQEDDINLTDITAQSQINFVHNYDGHGEKFIVEEVAGGIGSLDFDLDGWIDVYFLNGASIPLEPDSSPSNALFRNLGGMRFVDVTSESHTGDILFSMGVAIADYNRDGFPDIFVTNFGQNMLYKNNGDGTFEDTTMSAKLVVTNQLGSGACFLDADRDGLLDLYVGNYVKSPVEKNVKRTTEGFPSYPGPLDFQTEPDWFFHNEGDGTFSDQTTKVGLSAYSSTSMGVISADFDDDGDPDLLVVNDVDRNLLFENDGTGRFEEVGILRGVAFSFDGRRNGNMGVDCADYNGDGKLDFFVTTFSNELPVLYKNDGSGNFEDVTIESGAGAGLLPHANWGNAFFDVENDGDQDLIVANGHTDPNVSQWAYTTSWKVKNTMLLNLGTGRFKDISPYCGSGLKAVESSRGLVVEDFDNDGDVDVIILNALAGPTVIRNDSRVGFNWLQLELKGKSACRDGTGSRVTIELMNKQLIQEVHSGRGYQSSYGQRLCFGLGEATQVPKLRVRWSDGAIEEFENIQSNQLLILVQK